MRSSPFAVLAGPYLAVAAALLTAACSSQPPATGPSCAAPQTSCDAVSCTDVSTDSKHCGACGTACQTSQVCLSGACVATDCAQTDCSDAQVCPDGLRCVEKSCVGVQCPAGQGCLSGNCISNSCASGPCPSGLLCVNGACSDVSCLGVLCMTGAVCSGGLCSSSPCNDGVKSGDESDVDCGGSCSARCAQGKGCASAADCASGACVAAHCEPPSTASCTDGAKNGDESDVDCGGSCPARCALGKSCALSADCASATCLSGRCETPLNASCADGVKNGDESDTDCGGSCPVKCPTGKACLAPADCASATCAATVCVEPSTCTDNLQSAAETDVDCGGLVCVRRCADGKKCTAGRDCASGSCVSQVCAGPSCTDGAKNGTETDIDCGGSCSVKCPTGKGCTVGNDCQGRVCAGLTCAPPSCTDTFQNGTETDVDCGGLCSQKCHGGQSCLTTTDCLAGLCTLGVCPSDPSCTDLVLNQDEVDVDCGGTHCLPCADGKTCKVPSDCTNLFCTPALKCSSGFPTGTSYPIGHPGTVVRVLVGKINGDNLLDVAALNGSYIDVFLGAPAATLGTSTAMTNCLAADLGLVKVDADNNLDLVSHCVSTTGYVTTQLGNGDGTFQAPMPTNTTAANNTSGPMVFADFNGDGKLDAVAATGFPNPANVGMLFGTGLGNFFPVVQLSPGASGSAGGQLALDVTGDGKPDLLTALRSGNLVSVLVNNTPVGGASPVFALSSVTFGGITDPLFLKSGDFNEDGKPDLAVATYNGQTLSLFLSNGAGFLPALNYGPVAGPREMVIADLNLDGHLDIAMATVSSGVMLFLGTGTGTFKRGRTIALPSGWSSAINTADFDGDGRPDLVAGSNNSAVWIYLNR